MLSAPTDTNDIKDAIILIDEPDSSLYPTGAEYLRDEIINNTSKKNYVIYSTHSPFMIDKKDLKRHIIVEKDNDITKFKYVNDSNYFDDEVIMNAIGATNMQGLKEDNIVFEGWKDEEMFNIFIKETKNTDLKPLKKYGTTFCGGDSNIKTLLLF